jgi:protein subunit release factor B
MDTVKPKFNTDPEVVESESEITVYRASGPGGQHRNKTESAVRIHHLPSGVIVVATENRSQLRNRKLALERLVERLRALNHRPKTRRRTRVPRKAHENRLQRKRIQSLRKNQRRKPGLDD